MPLRVTRQSETFWVTNKYLIITVLILIRPVTLHLMVLIHLETWNATV
jgi:hypothetical protein